MTEVAGLRALILSEVSLCLSVRVNTKVLNFIPDHKYILPVQHFQVLENIHIFNRLDIYIVRDFIFMCEY